MEAAGCTRVFVFCIKRLKQGGHQTANPPSMPSPAEQPPWGRTLLPGMLMCCALRRQMGLGFSPCPEQGRAAPELLQGRAEPGWMNLGTGKCWGTGGMAAGSDCSATTSAPQPQCPGRISSPATPLSHLQHPGTWRGLHWPSSSCRSEPALFNQSSHWQSISSAQRLICQHRHSSVPQSKPWAAASLLGQPLPPVIAPVLAPSSPGLSLHQDGPCTPAMPPWLCCATLAAPGPAQASSCCPAMVIFALGSSNPSLGSFFSFLSCGVIAASDCSPLMLWFGCWCTCSLSGNKEVKNM